MRADDAILAGLLLWAALIAIVDWRSRRVPNLLLLAALLPAVAGLAGQGVGPQGANIWLSLAGFTAGFLVVVPGYLAKRLGAGDVKLAAVMGLLLGWPLLLWCLLASALLLGAMSFLAVTLLGFANARSLRLPAAVALAGGFVAVLLASREGWL